MKWEQRERRFDMEYPDYEFYVLNGTWNKGATGPYGQECRIERFNIFRNWPMAEAVFKACKKHLRNKKKFTYDELKGEIRSSIMHQEWSRAEYECVVGPWPTHDESEFVKVDCYWQAEPNMEIITDMCLKRTKEYLKARKNEQK